MKPEIIQKTRETALASLKAAKEYMAMLRDGRQIEAGRQAALNAAVREDLDLRPLLDRLRVAGVAIWPDLLAAQEEAINEARALGINLGNDHGPSPQEAEAAKQAFTAIVSTRELIADLREDLADPDADDETKGEFIVLIRDGYDEVAGLVHRLKDAGVAAPDLLAAFDVIHREVMELNAAHAFWPQLGNIGAAPEPRHEVQPMHAAAANDTDCADILDLAGAFAGANVECAFDNAS
jgi:hypothetical protein